MNQPPWIEHDGSAVCPVPAGHDVEMRLRSMKGSLRGSPEVMRWEHENAGGDITHYRDWTAWDQSKMTKADDVPEWAYVRAAELANADGSYYTAEGIKEWSAGEASARYIAAHEPAPVDPLEQFAREIVAEAKPRTKNQRNAILAGEAGQSQSARVLAVLRARSVTLDSKGEG